MPAKKIKKRIYTMAKRYTKKAFTPKKQRQWKHVYESARKRGFSEARSIMQASGVVKKRRSHKRNLKSNPVRPLPPKKHVIEAQTKSGDYFWTGEKFVSERDRAKTYRTSSTAMVIAKQLLPKLPDKVHALAVVPY